LGQEPSSSQGDDDDVVKIDVNVGKKTGVTDSPAQVIIFYSTGRDVSHWRGVFGHVAYVIDGRVWSWESHGWDNRHLPLQEYLKENEYRSGTGYVLDFGSVQNIRFKEGLIGAYEGTGGYGLFHNNCGEAFCRAMNAIGGHGWEPGMSPGDHERFILNNLKPYGYVRQVVPYGPR
jgi:hypothetical protein